MEIFTIHDVLFEITRWLDPCTAIQFLYVNKRTYLVHNDSRVYNDIIKRYYSNVYPTNTPYRQLLALVNNKTNNYIVLIDDDSVVIDNKGNYVDLYSITTNKVFKNNGDYSDHDIDFFNIKGLQPCDGEIYWLFTTITATTNIIKAFITLDDAIEYFIKHTFFVDQDVKDYCKTNLYFKYTSPFMDGDIVWQFTKIEINNTYYDV